MAVAVSGSEAPVHPEALGTRYRVHEELGRGGMASVHRATDVTSGRQVALKLLAMDATHKSYQGIVTLFEREFHTLAQLRHPHVIEVYDYGLSATGQPYYTMELLDGGDLREGVPWTWREACHLFFQVASSLALIHSRRLLHRDVSPRNIRRTRAGHAKLIDFGALAPMNAGGADVVGTPAFTAPETLYRLALDARTDLFSLGATLYYVLTGELPFPVRTFADALTAWQGSVRLPSEIVSDVPPALDELVASLIRVDPRMRPPRAFDVMQRLAAIGGLSSNESVAVPRSYLVAPRLVGRADEVARMQEQLLTARRGRVSGLLVSGTAGLGRSRLLDTCALEAKTLGYTVLRAVAHAPRNAYAVTQGLLQHFVQVAPVQAHLRSFPDLFESVDAVGVPANDTGLGPARPQLRDFAERSSDGAALQTSVCRLLLSASQVQPLVIMVDDIHRIDTTSAAILAELLDSPMAGRIVVAATVDADEARGAAVEALAGRCEKLTLSALTREQTELLMESLFGDVANVSMVTSEVYKISLGNPQRALNIAQHLVDRESIRYDAGTWLLPARLSAADLPSDVGHALVARIATLSPRARMLAEAHALAFSETWSVEDYRRFEPAWDAREVDSALLELEELQVIVSDGAAYVPANRLWVEALRSQMSPEMLRDRHGALADACEGRLPIGVVYHRFMAGQGERGLDALQEFARPLMEHFDMQSLLEQEIGKLVWCLPEAISTAERLDRSPREVHELRRLYCAGCIAVDENVDFGLWQAWFDQLAHDSGRDLYQRALDTTEPAERLQQALQGASERYLSTPDAERVYGIQEALQRLGEYVVYGIALGGRNHDSDLLRSLPSILEPFVTLSPALDAIEKNAVAACRGHVEGRYDSALEIWKTVLTDLDPFTNEQVAHIDAIRNAVAYAIGMLEARNGLVSAVRWADRLAQDPMQRVGALQLRKIVRLMQGDRVGADKLRRQAEVLALQMHVVPMFHSLLVVELSAAIKARDLDGILQLVERIRPVAQRHAGWMPYLVAGEGSFSLISGDYDKALAKFQECIDMCRPDAHGQSLSVAMWVSAHGAIAETLLRLERPDQAREVALAGLAFCDERQIHGIADDMIRTLALAEVTLGDPVGVARLDALIAGQLELGVSGLHLGCSYEARAQIALWQNDVAGFERYGELTAREYRYGAGCVLGARYEALMSEAARRGMRASGSLRTFDMRAAQSTATHEETLNTMWRSLLSTPSLSDRAATALQIMCAVSGAASAHLYLMAGGGLAQVGSHGLCSSAPELTEVQRRFKAACRRARDIDEMQTGDMDDETPSAPGLEVEDDAYELLLLECPQGSRRAIAGAVAIEQGAGSPVNPQRARWTQTLAEHFLEHGDTPGLIE